MFSIKRGFLLALLPLLLLALWGFNWRILHPAPSATDVQVRALLKEMDRIEVKVEYFKKGAGPWGETVLILSPSQTQSVTQQLNLTETPWKNMPTQSFPVVYLRFFRKGDLRAEIVTSYNAQKYNYYVEHPARELGVISRSGALHAGSALRLRQLIGEYPAVTRILLREGAQPKNLAPKAFIPEAR